MHPAAAGKQVRLPAGIPQRCHAPGWKPCSRAAGCFAWLLLIAAVLAPRAAWSASERELSLDEMVGLADDIVVGRVTRSEARWQGKLIVTVSTVQVSESLKGRPQSEIDITQLGGTAVHPGIGASVTMTASEEALLQPGEDIVLFVRQTKPGIRQIVGGAQGKFVVREEPQTRVQKLPVAPKTLTVHRETGRDVVSTESMTLDALRERVQDAVKRERKQSP